MILQLTDWFFLGPGNNPTTVMFKYKCITQTWNFERAREHRSRKNYVKLWKDLWNSSQLGCGSKFFESFPQNVA